MPRILVWASLNAVCLCSQYLLLLSAGGGDVVGPALPPAVVHSYPVVGGVVGVSALLHPVLPLLMLFPPSGPACQGSDQSAPP